MGFYFFFFQAEDGIRDADVTGVQTCALPISLEQFERDRVIERLQPKIAHLSARLAADVAPLASVGEVRQRGRSEERRVGKEWGWGGWAGGGKERRVHGSTGM